MTVAEFDKLIATPGYVVVDFLAKWCGPCRLQTPILEELQKETPFTLVKVDIEESEEVTLRYNISVLPTLVILKDGTEVVTLTQLQDKTALRRYLV